MHPHTHTHTHLPCLRVCVCVCVHSLHVHAAPIGVYVVVNWSVRSMTAISGSFTTLMRMIAALKRLFHTLTKLINTGSHLNTPRSSSSSPPPLLLLPPSLSPSLSLSFCLLLPRFSFLSFLFPPSVSLSSLSRLIVSSFLPLFPSSLLFFYFFTSSL